MVAKESKTLYVLHMSKHTENQRYYYAYGKRLKNTAYIALVGVATFVYGSYLHNRVVGVFFMVLSTVYPLVILLALLQNTRRFSYVDVVADGLSVRTLGKFYKHIRWSDVMSVTLVSINGLEGMGVTYGPGYTRHSWIMRYRLKTFGYEDLIRQAYTDNGKMLTETATTNYAKAKGRTSPKAAKARQAASAPAVHIKSSFSIAEIWHKPNSLAWFGVSLVCNMVAGMARHQYHTLSVVLSVLGVISLGFAGASLNRYRRVSPADRATQKSSKPNDWSTLE